MYRFLLEALSVIDEKIVLQNKSLLFEIEMFSLLPMVIDVVGEEEQEQYSSLVVVVYHFPERLEQRNFVVRSEKELS
jgi:hypothetical protein